MLTDRNITPDERALGAGVSDIATALGLSRTPQNFDVFPWSIDPRGEAFFAPLKIDWKRWDKFYPYRLLVIDARTKKTIVKSGQARVSVHTLLSSDIPGGFEYVLTQEILNDSWELNLPITPQQLRVADSFAINTSATARGVIEEHSGVRFKNIMASGTCGIWARRDTRAVTPIQPTSLESIFSGTIDNLKNLKKIGTHLFSKGGYPASTTSAVPPEKSSGGEFSTGYFQALYLGQFLERYAQEKKKPQNRHWRLVFHMPKNNDAYIVTPVSFVGDRNASRPQEYMWSMQLKAWKRIELDSPTPIEGTIPTLGANTFQRVLNTISQTRSLLASATNTVKAIRSDFARTFNILRQTALAIKDTAGFIRTVADLPSQVVSDAKSSISDALSIINSSFKDGFSEGLSSDAIAAGALGLGAIQLQQLSANNSIFENPEENFDLLDTVPVDSLALTPEQLNAIEDEQESIALLTTDDFVQFRSELQSLALDISNNFGAGNEQYSQTYGRPAPKTRVTPMTLEENDILISLYETIQSYDLLTVKKTFDDLKSVNSLDYVGGLADQAGISFDIATSKFMVPVPFGLTIEELAARYLGDSNKWVEIVTINNLKPPYIDETGFFYDMISNAEGRQLNVDDNQRKLYVGQKIIISSDTVPAFTRKIISIEKIDDDNFLVNVDGLANLDNLTIVDNAKIHAYLPGTVNSQNQIYIPVNAPSQADDRIRTPSHLDEDALTRISGIDFLLTDDGDVAINSVGDFRLANGLTNLIQALKLKIKTKKGTLLRHLDFGLGISPGVSVADINNGTLLLEMNKIIQDDSRFSGIDRLIIKMNGSVMLIDMAVKISNGSGIVPITFEV